MSVVNVIIMSDYKILLFCLFVVGVDYSNGQCDLFPDTTCKRIEKCEVLNPLVTKTTKSSDELNYLRKRTCGFDGIIPQICCPNNMNCLTPDGVNGQCVDIHDCSYFVSLIRNNPSTHDITFIKRSRCYGPADYGVCCTPAPPLRPIHPMNANQKDDLSDRCPATALPPGPESCCCGQDDGTNKISGGYTANVDQFTWLVLIEYLKDNSDKIVTNCGGALISGRYVLTAAHCVDPGSNYILTSVRLGEYNINNSGPDCVEVEGGGQDCTYGAISIPVERIIKHQHYEKSSPNVWNDIALLRLAQMATYNYFVSPICLPTANISVSSPDSRLLVAGWGAIDENHNYSPVKQAVDIPLVDLNTCRNLFSKFTYPPRLWSGQLCAGGEPGKDSCKGDSGGPLIKLNKDRYEIVGIVSYGVIPCGTSPGVYTNVYAYLDWIRSNMQE